MIWKAENKIEWGRWNEHVGNNIIIEILAEWIRIKRKIAWMKWKLGK